MKTRVVKKGDKFYSEYHTENSKYNDGWEGTYRTLNSITQNRFDTMEEAVSECEWFANEHAKRQVVWQKEFPNIM